jgi:hypothetical protein
MDSNEQLQDSTTDVELNVMAGMLKEVSKIKEDPAAVNRVMVWLSNKLNFASVAPKGPSRPSNGDKGSQTSEQQQGAHSEIAEINEDGTLLLHLRDLKAKTKIDATKRLVLITLLLAEELSGKKTVSSKNVLLPLLKEWRVYDGNTREFIATYQGIHRKGDELSLDKPGKDEARKYLAEIADETIIGSWSPAQASRPVKKKAKTTGATTEASVGENNDLQ